MIHSVEGPTEHFKIINFLLLLKESNLFHKRSEYSCNAVLYSRKNLRSYHTAKYVFNLKTKLEETYLTDCIKINHKCAVKGHKNVNTLLHKVSLLKLYL